VSVPVVFSAKLVSEPVATLSVVPVVSLLESALVSVGALVVAVAPLPPVVVLVTADVPVGPVVVDVLSAVVLEVGTDDASVPVDDGTGGSTGASSREQAASTNTIPTDVRRDVVQRRPSSEDVPLRHQRGLMLLMIKKVINE
jgi:hypothetical protein